MGDFSPCWSNNPWTEDGKTNSANQRIDLLQEESILCGKEVLAVAPSSSPCCLYPKPHTKIVKNNGMKVRVHAKFYLMKQTICDYH
jgi:hypothetical protein